LSFTPLKIEQPPVPGLSYGLDRVLFNPGVYHLQDERSRVYNFDPYLQKIMPVNEFDFNALKRYITSSQDRTLSAMAKKHGRKYVGSTSSMTAVLAHFHYLLSQWRGINTGVLSKGFPANYTSFTKINRAPVAIFLRWKNGTYAIDADKQYDSANILSMLGKSMEKLLTLPTDKFERYRRTSQETVSEAERSDPEAYQYSTLGDFMMRSQLDAYDPRLPGTGMFDLKTRAVVSIRHDVHRHEINSGYQIRHNRGEWNSYEREYYDMMRSTLLKYSLQARMGNMDGIFVAFHNVERIFGFQYVSIPEMDRALHQAEGGRHLGDMEFKFSLKLLNEVLEKATQKFPETSIRLHFETRETNANFMYIFARPVTEEEADSIQNSNKEKTEEFERKALGLNKSDTEDMSPEWEIIREETEERRDVSLSSTSDSAPPLGEESAETSRAEDKVNGKADPGEPVREEGYEGPLLGMTLTIRNKVNGTFIKTPPDLGPDMKWQVEYLLEEIEEHAKPHLIYQALLKRRSSALKKHVNGMEDEDESEQALSFYQAQLREMSVEGRKWRQEQDK
ncbi:Pet127-domain-containing protein, partial [Saccharata proteae CBS 121410]